MARYRVIFDDLAEVFRPGATVTDGNHVLRIPPDMKPLTFAIIFEAPTKEAAEVMVEENDQLKDLGSWHIENE